jgi:ATP-dependent Zn protease
MAKQTDSTNHPSLRGLALLASGRSGADIERLVREVRQKARRERRTMTWSDIEKALLAGQMPMSDDLRWRTAIHEAGHALAFSLTGVAEVRSITIGLAAMGEVLTRRFEHLAQTEAWLAKMTACMLAGRTAELMVFGETLAGSGGNDGSDLARATAYAMAAETTLGFSEHQPLVYRSASGSGTELDRDRHLAERVNARLLAAEAIARELLENRRADLIGVARQLKEVGVLSGEEVRRRLLVPDAPPP